MVQLWIMLIVGIVGAHDAGLHAPSANLESPWMLVLWMIAGHAGLWLFAELTIARRGRELDKTGSWRSLRGADRTLESSRLFSVLWHGVCVLQLGVLEAVRSLVGDLVMVDELLVMAPTVLVFVGGWWSYAPIARRLHEASWIRVLEEGQPAYPALSRGQYVWAQVRHQLLFVLIPIIVLLGWAELCGLGIGSMLQHEQHGLVERVARTLNGSQETLALVLAGLHLFGAAVVFTLAPVMVRVIWDTGALPPSMLRDRLQRVLTDAKVRVRELLIWRTNGTLMNGAAVGFVPRLRYILLTDALLETLRGPEVEAVMAHEVAHVRFRHIPWLVGGLLACVGSVDLMLGGITWVLDVLIDELGTRMSASAWMTWTIGGIELVGLGGIVIIFGWISRRFEWQADAYAAQYMTRTLAGDGPPMVSVSGPGAGAMISALDRVARSNHIVIERKSFRHGSIGQRQRNLGELVGKPLTGLPIDQVVRRVKWAIRVGVVLTFGQVVWQIVMSGS